MHKIINLFLTSSLVLIYGCSNGNSFLSGAKVLFSEENIVESAQLSEVDFLNDGLMGKWDLVPVNDSLIIIQHEGLPYFYTVVSPTHSTHFLNKGRGPGELLSADLLGYSSQNGITKMEIFDFSQSSVVGLDVTNTSRTGKANVLLNAKLQHRVPSMLTNGDLYLAYNSAEGDIRYDILDSFFEIKESISLFGKGEHLKDYSFFSSADCIKPDGTKVAMGMMFLDKLNILNLKNGRGITVVTDRSLVNSNDFDIMKQNLSREEGYYFNICCDDEYIYAIHYPGTEIRIFDWDGHYIRKILLNEPIGRIRKSMDGNRLYGITMDERVVFF